MGNITATFDTVTGCYFVDGSLGEYADFMKNLGFISVGKWRLPLHRKTNGVDSFSVFYTRWRKSITLKDVPEYAMPTKLSVADLERALPKNKLTMVGNRLCLQYKLDTGRVWAEQLTGRYDASQMRFFLFETGWVNEDSKWYLKPDAWWLSMYWGRMCFDVYVEVDPDVLKTVQDINTREARKVELWSKAKVNLAKLAVTPPKGTYPMYAHQKDWAINLQHPNSILAFDMGLGKTLSAMYWALAFYNSSIEPIDVYILCPKSVKPSWKAYSEMTAFDHIHFIINSWAAVPEPPVTDYVLIGDESHYTQDPESKRSQEFLALSKGAMATLCLSGTPSKNGTCRDIFVQLQACRFPPAINQATYVTRYGWQDEMKLDKLGRDASSYIKYTHKSKALDLPPKVRVAHTISLSPKYLRLYNDRYIEFMESFHGRVAAGEVSGYLENLVAMSGMRLAAALGKVEGVVELVKDILPNQVGVFFDFREAIDLCCNLLTNAGISWVCLESKDSETVRGKKIKDFQAGKYSVFLTSYKCGGAGIELTPCTYLILGDRPWTPGDAVQAEDRAHRIGQIEQLTVYWVYWEDPERIEEKVDNLIHSKQTNINDLLKSNVSLGCA